MKAEFPTKPLLVHSDLTVVAENLKVISNSFWDYQKLNPGYKTLNHLLIQNIATGCTMMINKQLKTIAHPIPKKAIMHDWWLALVASLYDGVHHVTVPTILYRQHVGNNVGAQKYSLHYFLSRYGRVHESIRKIMEQGKQLSDSYKNQLNEEQTQVLETLINLFQKNRVARLKDIFTYRFRMHGLLRNLGFILTVFLLNKRKINK